MNRMLTVWIDDSTKQDVAVLEHRKEAETGEVLSFENDTDVPVCRAVWEILKGAVRRVKIPYAKRIGFSVTHNRRNPGMLFDLIKCHALLHVFSGRQTGTARSSRPMTTSGMHAGSIWPLMVKGAARRRS
jgi:hypothetical protein